MGGLTLFGFYLGYPGPFMASALRSLVGVFVVVQGLLLMFSSHRYLTLWRVARKRPGLPRPVPRTPTAWPRVTVQLPIYNERLVVQRLIDSVAAMEYPGHLLEIQVLDDSTDETSSQAEAAAARHRAKGVDI